MATTFSLSSPLLLHNGVQVPQIGLGTWQSRNGEEVVSAVTHALKVGYRHIDTASIYGNETGIGKAIREAGIPREQLFVTTKVWNSKQGYESTLKAFDQSLNELGLDYIDLYLIHWPVKGKFKHTWQALEELYEEGKVKAIGVSNFHVHHLEELFRSAHILPMVNQIELHPLLTQKEIIGFCHQHKIQVEAWSPLMQGHLDLPLLGALSTKYDRSPAQIVLRWNLQIGVITIPKSVTLRRIEENARIFDFELEETDVLALDGLNINRRFGPDPDNFYF